MLYPYSEKKLCSFPPSVDFFASDMPTRKTNIEGAENTTTVPTNVTSIVGWLQ